jgi:hypothetical protein
MVCSVAAVPVFTVCATCNVISHVKYGTYFSIGTLWNMWAVPNMAVFCSSLISCFPGMLLRYCLNDFVIVPVAPRYYWYHFCCDIPLSSSSFPITFMQGICDYVPGTNHVSGYLV